MLKKHSMMTRHWCEIIASLEVSDSKLYEKLALATLRTLGGMNTSVSLTSREVSSLRSVLDLGTEHGSALLRIAAKPYSWVIHYSLQIPAPRSSVKAKQTPSSSGK